MDENERIDKERLETFYLKGLKLANKKMKKENEKMKKKNEKMRKNLIKANKDAGKIFEKVQKDDQFYELSELDELDIIIELIDKYKEPESCCTLDVATGNTHFSAWFSNDYQNITIEVYKIAKIIREVPITALLGKIKQTIAGKFAKYTGYSTCKDCDFNDPLYGCTNTASMCPTIVEYQKQKNLPKGGCYHGAHGC